MAWRAGGWKAILLLSVIIPVSVLTGLKLAGISGPAPIETISINPVSWQFYRTSGPVDIFQFLNATYADDAGQMSFSVHLCKYLPPVDGIPNDLVVVPSFSAAPLSKDFSVVSVIFSFGRESQPSLIDLHVLIASSQNLSLASYSYGRPAYAQFNGNGSPAGVNCSFFAVDWYLPTGNNVTSSMEITCEVTYFNGTAYKRVVQPFDLTLIGGAWARLNIGSLIASHNTSGAVSGVNVWVDGQLYSTPVSGILVTQGVHNITASPSINIGGTSYRFSVWNSGASDNSIMLNITSDLSIAAIYMSTLLGS